MDMKLANLIIELIRENVKAHFDDLGLWPLPRIYAPAGSERVAALEEKAGQPLEEHYRRFLALTDGLDGFHLSMPIFGCHDWSDGGRAADALRFREILLEDDALADVGLPEGTSLFPVSINDDRSQDIFMIDAGPGVPERFWWVGGGKTSCSGHSRTSSPT
ncbi:SMI1/KNR4 family protein [Streptomyces sp. RerS4]|uniref:SMI1/KNR4 family protein n=1 Tax=Streptomyces sp. RerS4 TaxID=2942449 RepID=UPI00201BE6EF|nr:SMI1/KNR4 family protein [Streptomyces sp. RerS4]UQX04764.1 SMI1/KNR4 family protein [Streptomyces sp. RerS4]